MSDGGEKRELASTVNLIAGRLCLDYVNTTSWRAGEDAEDQDELLRTYGDLVAWGRHAGILTQDEAERLLAAGERHPDQAAATLRHALALREVLFRLFVAAMRGQMAGAGDIEAFNAALARTLAQARIAPDVGGYVWSWASDDDDLNGMLRPIVRSAADLLTSAAEMRHVRACAGERCDWLFLDTSRNHSRRWCSMDDCGNRAKARRHYRRQRSDAAPP